MLRQKKKKNKLNPLVNRSRLGELGEDSSANKKPMLISARLFLFFLRTIIRFLVVWAWLLHSFCPRASPF